MTKVTFQQIFSHLYAVIQSMFRLICYKDVTMYDCAGLAKFLSSVLKSCSVMY